MLLHFDTRFGPSASVFCFVNLQKLFIGKTATFSFKKNKRCHHFLFQINLKVVFLVLKRFQINVSDILGGRNISPPFRLLSCDTLNIYYIVYDIAQEKASKRPTIAVQNTQQVKPIFLHSSNDTLQNGILTDDQLVPSLSSI